MTDFSNHTYRELFAFLQKGIDQYREKQDFSQYLVPMEDATSVKSLVVIYNNYYFMLAYFILFGRMPQIWYQVKGLGPGNAYLFEDLSNYFNENVVRLLKESPNPSIEQRQFCLANLRQSEDVKRFHGEIVVNADKMTNGTFQEIIFAKYLQHKNRIQIERDGNFSQRTPSNLMTYKEKSLVLLKYHRIFDIAELRFGKEFGVEYNIDVLQAECQAYQAKLLQEKQKREAREKELELERKKREKEEMRWSSSNGFMDDAGGLAASIAAGAAVGFFNAIFSLARKGK